MNRLALALVFALTTLFAASSASACGMYQPIDPDELLMASVMIEEGDAALKRDELRTAVRKYNRAMNATGPSKTRASAAIKAGQVYTRLGKTKQAIRRFERAIRVAPFYGAGHIALGFALMDDDPKKAIVHLEAGLATSGQAVPDAYAGLAIAYARTGDAAKAKLHLQNARLNGASAERIIAAEKLLEQGALAAIAASS